MKINEVITQGTVQKVIPPSGGSNTSMATINVPGSNNPITVPTPQGSVTQDPNTKTFNIATQDPTKLQAGAKVNIVDPSNQQVTEEDDDLETKSDDELIALAQENDIDDTDIRLIDGELANRDEVIQLLRGDIGGDPTDCLIAQVIDPNYGTLSEMKRLAGL